MQKFPKVTRILDAYNKGRLDARIGSNEDCPFADGTDTAFAYHQGKIDYNSEYSVYEELDNLKERMKDVRSAIDAARSLTMDVEGC